MKEAHPHKSLVRLCWLFGISRQAVYKNQQASIASHRQAAIVMQLVHELRAVHPAMGTRKLQVLLQPALQQAGIQLGRDALFALLREHHCLLRRRRRKIATTWSKHPFRKYRNLIRNFTPTAPNQLWVSDITYLRLPSGGFLFLSLITDAYSRKIVGYDLADNLEAVNTLHALQMAIDNTPLPLQGLIHHSDRGLQYCCHDYVNLLRHHHIQISMTENGDPLENAIAERVNGILKQEYLQHQPIRDKHQARQLLEKAVTLYNHHRPHLSCNMQTPHQIHQQLQTPKRLWKSYYTKNSTLVNPLQDLETIVNPT